MEMRLLPAKKKPLLTHPINADSHSRMTRKTKEPRIENALKEARKQALVRWATADMILKYPPKSLLDLCEARAVLQIGLDFKKGDSGYSSKGEFYQAFTRILATLQLKYLRISNVRVLQNKMARARKQGILKAVQIPNLNNTHASIRSNCSKLPLLTGSVQDSQRQH